MKPEIQTLQARDRAARALKLLDTPAEERFDRVTRLCQRLFGAPFSMVSLLHEKRQWFKSAQGHLLAETPLTESFCQHTVNEPDGTMVITDPVSDERFSSIPAVTDMGMKFYAGVSLEFQGQRIGTLCVLDTERRSFDARSAQTLQDLARIVETELGLECLTAVEREVLESGVDLQVDPISRCWDSRSIQILLESTCEKTTETVGLYLFDAQASSDQLLRATADQLRRAVAGQAMIGIWEENRFLLVYPGLPAAEATRRGEEILGDLLAQKRKASSLLGIHAGLSVRTERMESPSELLRLAESALLLAQQTPGGAVRQAANSQFHK